MHGPGIHRRRRLALNAKADWIGIDWGTTHRRAWRFAAGALVAHVEDAQGLTACAPQFAASLVDLLRSLGAQPGETTVVMSGMVGSASGWQEVPYLDASTSLSELPLRLQPVTQPDAPPDVWIVPGVRWRGERDVVDVMRGEETQLFGAMHRAGKSSDGWYLLPGTHTKWVHLHDGRIEWMRTYLSGELFGLLRERGTLASIMRTGEADLLDEPSQVAFQRGVAASSNAALGNALFAARAQVVTGGLAPALGAAFVSGTLFGAEWRDMAAMLGQARTVLAIGDARLCALHARCAALHGIALEIMDIAEVQKAAWMHLRSPDGRSEERSR